MIQKSNGLSKTSNLDDDKSGPKYKCKSSATTLKIEIDSLIEQLNQTVCNPNKYKPIEIVCYVSYNFFIFFKEAHFVRCILPNNTKQRGKFDDELVLRQLITSSTIAFARFMRFGYSEHISLEKMMGEFKLVETKLNKWSANRSNFYSKVLIALGYKLADFKIGRDLIFFRTNKIRLLEDIFCEIKAISHSKLLVTKQARHPK